MRLQTFLAAALLLAAAAPARATRDYTEPGNFPVGVTNLTFTKTSVTTGLPRVLDTIIWYPATRNSGVSEELGLRDATLRRGRHPLVIFSHGSCGSPREATYLTKALASRGFVVAAPPHVGNTRDDGAACITNFVDSFVNRVPDVRFVLDALLAENTAPASPLYRHLDPNRLGITGLSFGGYTTLSAAQLEPRFRAALALVPGGTEVLGPDDITIPTTVIGAEHDQVVGFPESEAAYARLAGPRFLVEVLAANHLSAVDDCFNETIGVDFCVPGDISQDEAHRLILRYAVPFVQRYVTDRKGTSRLLVAKTPGVVLRAEPKRTAQP